ncbi:hypothetical protein FFI89_014535 [Bradyrhizobium sp. KBS0727]|nr:hypothetical protein FFI71_014530 [Bradyrhizobium sp. KBS0725]QDW44860.1 hypothetical protein FFI89_014535 [Bradyrhizobium sp. KBS0727]
MVSVMLSNLHGERTKILRRVSKCVRHGRACPGHPRLSCCTPVKAWMPGTSPGMTVDGLRATYPSAPTSNTSPS